jgi:hypothetical protein
MKRVSRDFRKQGMRRGDGLKCLRTVSNDRDWYWNVVDLQVLISMEKRSCN